MAVPEHHDRRLLLDRYAVDLDERSRLGEYRLNNARGNA
jgi:hypothetical protein